MAERKDKYRLGVGIMLVNREGMVLVCRRNDVEGSAWQMPQGGLARGEDPRVGALRELKEEIGTDNAVIVAETKDWLCYQLPAPLRPTTWGGKYVGQQQKWFLMRFLGSDDEINVDMQIPEFNSWMWVSPKDLPALVVSFKRDLYNTLVDEFGALFRQDTAQAGAA